MTCFVSRPSGITLRIASQCVNPGALLCGLHVAHCVCRCDFGLVRSVVVELCTTVCGVELWLSCPVRPVLSCRRQHRYLNIVAYNIYTLTLILRGETQHQLCKAVQMLSRAGALLSISVCGTTTAVLCSSTVL